MQEFRVHGTSLMDASLTGTARLKMIVASTSMVVQHMVLMKIALECPCALLSKSKEQVMTMTKNVLECPFALMSEMRKAAIIQMKSVLECPCALMSTRTNLMTSVLECPCAPVVQKDGKVDFDILFDGRLIQVRSSCACSTIVAMMLILWGGSDPGTSCWIAAGGFWSSTQVCVFSVGTLPHGAKSPLHTPSHPLHWRDNPYRAPSGVVA